MSDVRWIAALLTLSLAVASACTQVERTAASCPTGAVEERMVQVADTRVEQTCAEMRNGRGCCLIANARVPFARHAANFQTWLCPERTGSSPKRGLGGGDLEEQVQPFHTAQAPWNLDRVDVRPRIFDQRYTPQPLGQDPGEVHVYVVDTGIAPTHSAFAGTPVSMDYPSAAEASDCNGHGTHVASVVASSAAGVVPEAGRVVLHAVRVLDCTGAGTTTTVIQGLSWIVNNLQRPAIINLSLGGPRSIILDDFIDAVRDEFDVLSVSAAGNENVDTCGRSPAGATGTIAVGATNARDERASYSNFGPCVDILAPGSDVVGAGTRDRTQYVLRSGTSMAAPHVSGALARLALTRPSARALVSEDIWQTLRARATRGAIAVRSSGTPNLFLFVGDPRQPPPDHMTREPPAVGFPPSLSSAAAAHVCGALAAASAALWLSAGP